MKALLNSIARHIEELILVSAAVTILLLFVYRINLDPITQLAECQYTADIFCGILATSGVFLFVASQIKAKKKQK